MPPKRRAPDSLPPGNTGLIAAKHGGTMLVPMEWDALFDTGRLWRVRVHLQDKPGALAGLTSRLAAAGVNLLAVSVLPAGPAGADEVVDEFVLRAPDALDDADLVRIVDAVGLRAAGVTPAEVGELVDAETAVLRAAMAAVSGRTTTAEALRRVLGADRVLPATRATSDDGHRATFTLPNQQRLVAERIWTPFTGGEIARANALLDLVGSRPPVARPELPTRPRPIPQAGRARRLSALDTVFLDVETRTSQTHVGNLLRLDPAALPGGRLTGAALRDIFAGRLHLVPPLRWRLRDTPLGLDLPYWEDTNYVDLNYHVREIALPEPGTDTQLAALIGELAARPLDRRFPLWEAYLVSGLAGGAQAFYAKVHHAVVDGVSGAEVLAAILDLTAEPMAVPPPANPPVYRSAPHPAAMVVGGVVRSVTAPLALLRSLPALVEHLRPLVPSAPATPFNAPVGPDRTFAFASIPLADVKTVKDAVGGTVNDVVMALCTTALRRWLIAHDALPNAPLFAAVPISVRTPETAGSGGNQISLMQVGLPTDAADPLHRITLLRTAVREAKDRAAQAPTTLLQTAALALPHILRGRIVRAVAGIGRLTNLVVSNVPGPQIPLYAAGARVTGCYPVSLVTDSSGGINITVMSYCGSLDIGIIACPDLVPDVDTLATYMRAGLDELLDLVADPSRRPPVPKRL